MLKKQSLSQVDPDFYIIKESEKLFYYKFHIIPWQKLNNTVFFVVEVISQSAIDWIKLHYGCDYVLLKIREEEILKFLNSHFGFSEFASNYLYYKNSSLSAREIKLSSKIYASFIIIISALTLVEEYTYFALILIFITSFSGSLFKFVATAFGLCKKVNKETENDNRNFPLYTILLPVFKENSVIFQLIENIERLDYPQSQLDVKLIIESDDHEMLKVIQRCSLPQYFEVITVPHSFPKTKAKACNYAMCYAKGEYIVIYDADDRPDPLQLKKALVEFNKNDDKLACVQAKLNYYNYDRNLLTKFFSLEYINWFYYLLPGLQKMNMPIPLGGSSNHFSIKALKKVFFWDSYNVTEDADLGLRLARMGYKTKIIDSETLEESPISVFAWIKQRARWIKGYMQTYVVCLKHITKFREFLLLNLFVGSTAFIFFTTPFLLSSLIFTNTLNELFLYYFVVFYIIDSTFLLIAVKQQKLSYQFYLLSLFFPVYRLLHSVAAFLALWEFIIYPQRWNKTNHGLWKRENQK